MTSNSLCVGGEVCGCVGLYQFLCVVSCGVSGVVQCGQVTRGSIISGCCGVRESLVWAIYFLFLLRYVLLGVVWQSLEKGGRRVLVFGRGIWKGLKLG